MYVLVFRHISMEHLGWIGPVLESAGVAARYVDRSFDPRQHGSVNDAAGLISMGGFMSANDSLDYIRQELGILEEVIALGKPVLGVCLGAQMVAKALGARVYRNPIPEFGWLPVERTDAGRIDPVLAGFCDPETVMHFHNETFELPSGATLLASSKDCPNQVFRYGANVYGFQFHLEATPEMLGEWCAAKENREALAKLPAPIDPEENKSRMEELSRTTFARWASLLEDSADAATT
jgi:GMP synthase (glutamine-hydrolysing)